MNLERDLADAELGRGLLVEQAACDQRQHLPLARRQGRKPSTQTSQLRSLAPGVAILSEGCVDRPHQIHVLEWLGQKVDRAGLDRAHRRRNVSVSGDEHDMRVIPLRDLALQIQSVDVREFDIQDQASRDVGLRIRHVFGSGTERHGVHVEARKKHGQRLADPTIVVHDEDDVVLRVRHSRHGTTCLGG